MKILAIETTGANASVAIIDQKKQISEETSDRKLSHLQSLIPMIDSLLEKCKLSIGDMTHIAVSEGPGSFTGIRIGMSTGKALAQALGIPAISVPTLKSFCWNLKDYRGLVCPIMDARRGQVYGGGYFRGGGLCIQGIKDDAWEIEEFLFASDKFSAGNNMDIMFLGDGVEPYREHIKRWAISTKRISTFDDMDLIIANEKDRFQKASSVAMLALAIAEDGGAKSFELMTPVYLRKAEAERKLEQRLASSGEDGFK